MSEAAAEEIGRQVIKCRQQQSRCEDYAREVRGLEHKIHLLEQGKD